VKDLIFALGHDHRDVVVLLFSAEALNLSDNRSNDGARGLFAMTF
jgi:hypothetical protein